MPTEYFNILINAGGVGAVILIIYTNQNWITKKLDELSNRIAGAHQRIDDLMLKGQRNEDR